MVLGMECVTDHRQSRPDDLKHLPSHFNFQECARYLSDSVIHLKTLLRSYLVVVLYRYRSCGVFSRGLLFWA